MSGLSGCVDCVMFCAFAVADCLLDHLSLAAICWALLVHECLLSGGLNPFDATFLTIVLVCVCVFSEEEDERRLAEQAALAAGGAPPAAADAARKKKK